ncbi:MULTISPECIES: prolyl oligopeptidase family serine peptidase [Brachybacterium]|uniref:S9 family peptidase n=2 Tax=Brachybacterium TaxID=43668 RepID=A0A426SIJ6_9MICO|nr:MULTISPECIES: prolyl oligopeptidase family serine peptidase [Brachybacterium]RRR17984.1 S9 family peptidase [Brachybacterium paraconglomeratum]GLI29261.1 protease [Brachybacterium conglomeratum]GLK05591.1 protease [Brachybacterium conglomeratum]
MTDHLVPAAPHPPLHAAETLLAPRPEPRPVQRILFGDAAELPFRWLRSIRTAEVRQHLAAENAHTDRATSALAPLRARLAETLADEVPQELSVPVLLDGWWYIDRTHPLDGVTFSRVRDCEAVRGPAGVPVPVPGQLLPGESVLVEDCRRVLGIALSPDHRLLARAEAAAAGCRLVVTDTETGVVVDDSVHGAGPDAVFSADSTALLHTRLDDLGRRAEVRRHVLGSDPSTDPVLLEEPDHWSELTLSRSRDGSALMIRSTSPVAAEVWTLDLAAPTATPVQVTDRLAGSSTVVEHAGDRLLLLHADPVTHRCVLAEAPLGPGTLPEGATPLLHAQEGESFESVEAFAGFVALQLRVGALPAVRVIPRRADGSLDVGAVRQIVTDGPLDAVRLEHTPDWDQRTVRCRVDSFLTPPTMIGVELDGGAQHVLQRVEVPGLDASRYVEKRLWATSPDRTRVPISLIARADVVADGTAPVLLHGHGVFGQSLDPLLQPEVLALADRGVVVAVAHVRGGGELGPQWHRDGRRQRRTHSVDDFVACADHLVASGWAAPDRIGAVGSGAGALVVGAAVNRAPELFRAVLAETPLVDPLETMLAAEVMLTLEEWTEFGDPAEDETAYRTLRACSPAENIRETEYPAVFALTALEGTDYPPSGAAIWVARLRERVTSDPAERPILLRVADSLEDGDDLRVEGGAWLLEQLGVADLA